MWAWKSKKQLKRKAKQVESRKIKESEKNSKEDSSLSKDRGDCRIIDIIEVIFNVRQREKERDVLDFRWKHYIFIQILLL